MLAQLVGWAQRQFEAMGRPDARELAVALVAAYEGIALLTNTLGDSSLVITEGRRLERWIDDLVQDDNPIASMVCSWSSACRSARECALLPADAVLVDDPPRLTSS